MNFLLTNFCCVLTRIVKSLWQNNNRIAAHARDSESPTVKPNVDPTVLNRHRTNASAFRYSIALAVLIFLAPAINAGAEIVYSAPAQGYGFGNYLFSGIAGLGNFVCPMNGPGATYSGAIQIGTSNFHPVFDVRCQGFDPVTGLPVNFSAGAFSWRFRCELGPGWLTDFSQPGRCYADKTDPIPGKNAGPPDSCVGNPINPGTANKFQRETDYIGTGSFPLQFARSYNTNLIPNPANNSVPGPQFYDWILDVYYWKWVRQDFAPVSPYVSNPKWTHTYSRNISGGPSVMYAEREDGKIKPFRLVSGSWVTDGDIRDSLIQLTDAMGVTTGWRFASVNADETELYNAAGMLTSITDRLGLTQTLIYDSSGRLGTVTDSRGRQLTFSYASNNNIATMTDSSGGVYAYAYDAAGNLASVTYPDNTPGNSSNNPKRIYLYNESANTSGANLPNALTGLTDENGTRFATWKYDTTGRAISSGHAGGAEKVTLSYNTPAVGQTTVSDYKDNATTANVSRTYGFSTILGVVKNNGISQPCTTGCGSAAAASTFDANGNVASRTDFNGNKTTFGYELARNLETQRIEALTSASATTPQTRTISTEWHANWRLSKRMAEPKRVTTYVYNGDGGAYCAPTTALVNGIPIGVLCSKTVTETTDTNGSLGFSATATVPANVRTWTYTYDSLGQLLTANGPRTDVTDITTYTYYTSNDASGNYRIGDFNTVTNALGHVTTISAYDAHGRPKTITDPNGLVTQLTYTPRGWLATRTVGGLLTQFSYDNVGQLTQVTMPDNSFIGYGYDAAHRLVQISNAAGDKIVYTLDLMGNRTKEEVFDAGNNVVQRKNSVFDNLSRLATELNAANTVIAAYTYDNNGNVKTQTQKYDAVTTNDAITSFDYDPLNRLTKITN